MEKLKKLLSLLIVGVVVVTSLVGGSVTSAALSVDKSPIRFYWEESGGKYNLYIDGFDEIIDRLSLADKGKTPDYVSKSVSLNLERERYETLFNIHISYTDSSYSGVKLEATIGQGYDIGTDNVAVKRYEKDDKKLKGGYVVTVTDKSMVNDLKNIKHIGYHSVSYYGKSGYFYENWSEAAYLPLSSADSTKNPNTVEKKEFADPVFKIVEKDGYVGFMLTVDKNMFDLVSELYGAGYDPTYIHKTSVIDYRVCMQNEGKDIYFGVVDQDTGAAVEWDEREQFSNYKLYTNIAWYKKNSDVGKKIIESSKLTTSSTIYYLTGGDRVFYGSTARTTSTFHSLEAIKYIKDLKAEVAGDVECTYTNVINIPKITVTDGENILEPDENYILSFNDCLDIGTATVTISGKGIYVGEVTRKYKVVPPKTTLTAKKSGTKYALSWKPVKEVTKYQIQYSTDGGKTYKSAGTLSGSKTSKSLKLPTGKTYRFRIRSYKTVDGKKYYSAWSKPVTVK